MSLPSRGRASPSSTQHHPRGPLRGMVPLDRSSGSKGLNAHGRTAQSRRTFLAETSRRGCPPGLWPLTELSSWTASDKAGRWAIDFAPSTLPHEGIVYSSYMTRSDQGLSRARTRVLQARSEWKSNRQSAVTAGDGPLRSRDLSPRQVLRDHTSSRLATRTAKAQAGAAAVGDDGVLPASTPVPS